MSMLELGVLVLTLLTAAVGSWSIYWARVEPTGRRGRGGRILFVLNLLAVGVTGLIAALAHAQGLAPLGLMGGLLIVGMLWEDPVPVVPPGSLGSQLPPHLPPDGQTP